MHPRGEYFLSRGGYLIAPPVVANIGLTNKCNLRCEICGSQKALDKRPGQRRHMKFETFCAVAETVFPFLQCVELNSQGDPLLYPEINNVLDAIRRHHCNVKVQTNGTLFTPRNVDLLAAMCGEVNISIDAVGQKFEEVRRGGVWQKAETGMRALLEKRDPRRLSVGFYPTMTARTIGETIPIVEWAEREGVDSVAFHRYAPLPEGESFERCPTDDDLVAARTALFDWVSERRPRVSVVFDGETLNKAAMQSWRRRHASAAKFLLKAADRRYFAPSYPTEAGTRSGDPDYICTTPNSYIEIGLDGQISACCRSQEVPLGYATSAEQFADAWFGENYALVRNSLNRGATGEFPLTYCEGCIAFHAPGALCGRRAMSYDGNLSDRADGLRFGVARDVIGELRAQDRRS
jgi:MoaA/NifB/PqqE/SkfB family radical SAM enzyme